MSRYRVKYTYLEYSNNIHGRVENGYDEFEAENAQDAVEQCRQEFYIASNVHITSVSKWSPYGYWIPISDNAWA